MIEHSYAEILQKYLISTGVVSSPTPTPGVWPLYVNALPSGTGIPGQAAGVLNTTGTLDGRTMDDGKKLMHPGYQIMLRAQKDSIAALKANQIEVELDNILRKTVVIGLKTYMIQSVSRTTPLIPIGSAEGALLLYTINGTMTVKEVI